MSNHFNKIKRSPFKTPTKKIESARKQLFVNSGKYKINIYDGRYVDWELFMYKIVSIPPIPTHKKMYYIIYILNEIIQ